ncbi:hypothetical protein HYV70_02680 [Candidatus Uhrbacteria bacterium]|nr:hypothetical protein [Candidatus Uhrbacteria bacterium]
MTREFFSEKGRKETGRQKKFRFVIETLSRQQTPEQIPASAQKLQKELEHFPFQWLLEELQKINRRVQSNSDFQDHIEGIKGIRWNEETQTLGSYKVINNIIQLNPKRIEEKIAWAVEDGLPEEQARTLVLTRILIHEFLHVYSVNHCYGMELLTNKKTGEMNIVRGVQESKHPVVKGEWAGPEKVYFEDLNEGIVDLISDAFFRIYMEDTGVPEKEQERFLDFFETIDSKKEHKLFVLDLIQKIAEDTGVSWEVAYEGFIHQLKKEGKLNQELQEWFVQLVGDELFQKAKFGGLSIQNHE